MTLYTQPNLTSGIDDAIVSTAQAVPSYPIMILVFVFFFVLLSGSNNQKRRTGSADIPFWAVLSSMATMMTALIMTLGDGIINLTTLGIVIALTIMCGVWFFFSRGQGDTP